MNVRPPRNCWVRRHGARDRGRQAGTRSRRPSSLKADMKAQLSSARPQPRSLSARPRAYRAPCRCWRDHEPEMLEIIACVDHDVESLQRPRQPRGKLGPADAAAQRDDAASPARDRRRSSEHVLSRSQTSAAAGARAVEMEAASEDGGDALVRLSHQQRGGRSKLVSESYFGHLELRPNRSGAPRDQPAPARPPRRAPRRRRRCATALQNCR